MKSDAYSQGSGLASSSAYTIALIKAGTNQPKIRLIEEPKKRNKKSWYVQKDIEDFIEKEK